MARKKCGACQKNTLKKVKLLTDALENGFEWEEALTYAGLSLRQQQKALRILLKNTPQPQKANLLAAINWGD